MSLFSGRHFVVFFIARHARAFRDGGILDRRRDAEWRLYNNGDYSGY